jgi:hypothetical protein
MRWVESPHEWGAVGNHRRNKQEHVEGWINLQPPTDEESLEADRSASLVFAEEQAGDQKTAQHKKEIDSRPTRSGKEGGDASVMDHHENDGYTAKDIEPRVSHRLTRLTTTSQSISCRPPHSGSARS